MILAIVYDMRYFMLVLSISIAAVWTSFRLLLLDDATLPLEELGDPANGLLLTFNMLLLADFDLGTFDGEYTVLLRIMFVLSMIMTPIVLLNLLIALMSDSYERIQDRADTEFQLLRARLIREQEAFMSASDKADPRLFPIGCTCWCQRAKQLGETRVGCSGRACRTSSRRRCGRGRQTATSRPRTHCDSYKDGCLLWKARLNQSTKPSTSACSGWRRTSPPLLHQ